MAVTPLYGPLASITTTAFGCHFHAFTFDMAQGVTGFYGFGDTWMQNYGTIASWSGSMAGFTTSGTSTDAVAVTPITTRAGVSATLTWNTATTVAGTMVFTGQNLAVNFLNTDTSAYSFVGSGAPTITWPAS